jgi:hypothetical protein
MFEIKPISILAFSGDISCDFESDDWENGFCNWKYDFGSTNVFTRMLAPSLDNSLKQRWKFGNFSKS